MNIFQRLQHCLDRHTYTGREGLKFGAAALSLAGLLLAASASAAPGFSNGFEDNDFGGWEIISRAGPNEIEIVGAEGSDQFPVYGNELDELVEPYKGELMLRMGTPKTRNETQPRGVNAISQEFEATSNSISMALRLFSLDHRGDDILRITLTPADPDGAPVDADTFYFFENKQGTKCTPSCEAVIDVGKRQDVIATDWQLIGFSGLEAGKVYTLSIELEAGQNESLGSWLYVDGGNEAPSAVINYNPKAPIEGDFVVFDCGQSSDPEGSELTCTWWVTGVTGAPNAPGYSEGNPIIGQNVVYSFPQDGAATVHLEVSDGEKSKSTTAAFSIGDQDPLVNALDVEVLAGGTVDLVCRWADPGVLDTQFASFTVMGGGEIIAEYPQATENDPALASGYARVTYQAPDQAPDPDGTVAGSCSVGSSTAPFTITVVDPEDFATSERNSNANNGSTLGAPTVKANQSILGRLADPTGVAVFELLNANGGKFTPGTEVVVTGHFPVDYDIVLLSGSKDPAAKPWASAPFVSVPFVSVPFVSVPFVSVPFVSVPFVSVPFVSVPFVSVPFVSVPFASAPFVSVPLTTSLWLDPGFSLSNFPLSQLAGAPDGSNISGADISFGDLGALNAGALANEPVFLKGISAEFGTNTEQVLVEVGPGEEGLYLAVIPQAGSFSSAPFNIEIEAATPKPTKDLLKAICEQGQELVPQNKTAAPVVLRTGGDETIIVTQRERMIATFWPEDPGQWDIWWNQMNSPGGFLSMVNATVISVPSVWYDSADAQPCNVAEQNAVAELIKGAIDTYRTANTKYVQLMGSLDIIPPYYVPDETQTGNESLFASDLFIQPGKPLSAAISEGYMLTDAFYVDSNPQPFNGRQLYLEDFSVSRLVETPDEILANAERFVDTGGVINLLSAQPRSTGYDFFIDGTEVVNNILEIQGTTNTLNNDGWNAEDLRCHFFGAGETCDKNVSALNAINAHMSYNAGLTAKGFACQYLGDSEDCPDSPLGEVFKSSESVGMYDDVPDPDAPDQLINLNGVTFSIGCHSGLSVPDAWGLPDDVGLPFDPARDWVQQLGTWVGSYNFAYGDTDVADRGTEGIMPLVIRNFTQGMTLGDALVQAKWEYGAGLFEFGVYDEKSLVGLNLFGMPQATLSTSVVSPTNTTSAFAEGTAATSPAGRIAITYIEQGQTPPEMTDGAIEMRSKDKGVWFTVDGQAQAILGRPLLPVVKPFNLREIETTSTHGVALRGGNYTTYFDENPVFPVQTHDLVTSIGEPQPCVETLSPSLVASMSRFDSPAQRLETLIVQPGQFQCKNAEQVAAGEAVRGDFRIWNSMVLELLHPVNGASDEDLKPPVVTRQELLGDPVSGDVQATLAAKDESGIREIIALIYSDDYDSAGNPIGTGTATEVNKVIVPPVTTDAETVVELTLENAFGKLLSFQYIDNAGNITAKTLKGALLRAIDVEIQTSIINLDGNTTILVKVSNFQLLEDPYLIIDYGDGTSDTFEFDDPKLSISTVTEDDGSVTATVSIIHDYSELGAFSTTVRVEVRASGAVGTDEKTLFTRCDGEDDVQPDADIIDCAIASNGTKLAINLAVRGEIVPDIQYRLFLPQTNTQIKYADGAVTGPKNLKPEGFPTGSNQITFLLDAVRLGWDGISPLEFQLETQNGVSGGDGGQGQGFVDQTEVLTYVP